MRVDTLRPYFLLTILLCALAFVVLVLKPFLAPLALAAIFAVILRPIFNRLIGYAGRRRSVAAFITLLIALVCILVPLGLVVGQIVVEAGNLYTSLSSGSGVSFISGVFGQLVAAVSQLLPGVTLNPEAIIADLDTYTQQALQVVISHLGGVLSSVTSLLLSLFIFLIALYYLLKDGPALKRAVVELSPLFDSDDQFVFSRLELAINSVVKGTLLVALIQGAIATIGYMLFGVPNAVLWGTTTAITALIPGVGTALILGPIVLYLFATGTAGSALGLLLWGVVAVGLIDNMLGPKLIGRGAQLHPLLILLSVLGGLAFFGPVGLFLGPLTVSLFLALLSIHAHTLARE